MSVFLLQILLLKTWLLAVLMTFSYKFKIQNTGPDLRFTCKENAYIVKWILKINQT